MRKPRIKFEGEKAVYHCITRVVGGQFLLGDKEKEVLRMHLWKLAAFCGVEILTYCLLDNHFHVLVRTPSKEEISVEEIVRRLGYMYPSDKVEFFESMLRSEDPEVGRNYRANLLSRMGDVSIFMKELKQRFTIWYNKSHSRFGTLWAERFKSVLVQDDLFALMTVAAYIDLNAVRAGLVEDPAK